RSVPHPVLSIARMRRLSLDQNRLHLLALAIPPHPRHRSMSASTTRPVRHSAPLPSPLSIVGGPHEAGPIRSWRADSLAFVWLDPGITPCCKSPKLAGGNFPARGRLNQRTPICIASIALARPLASLSAGDEVPHIFTRKSCLQPGEFLITSTKRLLQQYLPTADLSKCS